MFDFSFTELIVVGVVALIVIGPERLPKVARTAGHLYGRMQRYVSSVKSDISQEIQMEEMRRVGQDFRDSVESVAMGIERQSTVVDDYLRNEANGLNKAVAAVAESGTVSATPKQPIQSKPALTTPQQSLPLDEPDQNVVNHSPVAVVETAQNDPTGKIHDRP